MTTQEFVSQLQDLYGPFTSEGMKIAVMRRISVLSDSQRDRLFEAYIRNIPGTYKPDLKNVLDCMDRAGIKPQEKKRVCPSCGYSWSSTSSCCPSCCYSSDQGDPEAYHYEFTHGKGRFNREKITRMMEEFANNIKFGGRR